ncbi:MAG: hypothetical protein U1D30_13350 [Planctomycetota bacterium]
MFQKTRRLFPRRVKSGRRGGRFRGKACEFRLLLIAVVATAGVLVCGWASSCLPAHYTAISIVQRDFAPAANESPRSSARELDPAKLLKEIAAPVVLNAVLHEQPAISAELDENHPLEDLRSRVTAGIEPLSAGSDRVWIRVAASTPKLAEQLSGQLARQYISRASRDAGSRNQEECLQEARRKLQALDATWNVARQELRELEAEREFTRDDATGVRFAKLQESLAIAKAQRDRIQQAISDPRNQLSLTPPLVNPARHTEPSLAEATLARYIERRDELAATFTPQHPAVRALDQKIAVLARESGLNEQTLTVAYKTSATTESSPLANRLAELDRKILGLEEDIATTATERERHDVALQDRLVKAYAQAESAGKEQARAREAVRRLEQASNSIVCRRATSLTVLDRADPSLQFEGYHRRRWFMAGAFCWLSLAGAAAFVVVRERR